MVNTDLVLMSNVQKEWNTTSTSGTNTFNYGYTWTHMRCNVKTDTKWEGGLDSRMEFWFFAFALSNICLVASLLFLSFFAILTGTRTSKWSLFVPGSLLFASSIATV